MEEAIAAFGRAIELKGEHPEGHNNLGNALLRTGRDEEALGHYRKAIDIRPGYVEAHMNLGQALRKVGRGEEAIACLRKSAELAPRNPDTHNSLALAYQDRGEIGEALRCLDQAVQLRPNHAQARINRALMLPASGNWEQGWEEYEWRWKLPDNHAEHLRFRQAMWDGGDMAGRTILLHCEQGLGSTIQFIRYATVIAQRGAKVMVECQPPLKALLGGLSGGIQVYARGEVLPPFDVHLALMSVPRVLRTTSETIPAGIPYLRADEALVGKWKAELAKIAGFKVGIAWQGNTAYLGDRQRSIRLRHFSPLGRIDGVRLVSLQKKRGLEQITEMADTLKVVDFVDRLDETTGPFMDTAAVIRNLDLVITSDTSIAHLAGRWA